MAEPLAWLTALSSVPGHNDLKMMLVGTPMNDASDTIWVGARRAGSGFSLHYVHQTDADTVHDIEPSKPMPRLNSIVRTLHVGLEQLADFVRGTSGWVYNVDNLVDYAVDTFLDAQLINSDTWNKYIANWMSETVGSDVVMPGEGHVNLRVRVLDPLTFYIDHMLQEDDPREFVLNAAHEKFEGGAALRVKIRSDVFSSQDTISIERSLRAVLPGVAIADYDPDGDNDYLRGVHATLTSNCELMVLRGDYDYEAWDQLDAQTINAMLRSLENDPVVRVAYGNYQMELLLVLKYVPDDQELAYISDVIPHVVRATRAKPRRLYGKRVVALFVPMLDDESDDGVEIEAIIAAAHGHLTFFN